MFAKLCLLAAALPAVLATIAFDTPTNVTAGLVSPVSWTADDSDPSFSLELNHPSFRNSLALANNVDPTNASPLSIEWPIVPADSQYTLSAVNVSNINQVFATSGQFSIAQAPTTASASVSTTFTTGSSASGASTTGSSSGASTTGGSASSASGASGASTGSSSTGSSSAPASSGSTGSFNGSGNGAASFKAGNTGVVAVILAAVAGATLFL